MASTENPRGLFNRATKGERSAPLEFTVEAGRIAFFADVLGETDPIHHSREAAQAAGHPDLVAPPTFPMVIDLETARQADAAGGTSILTRIGCDLRRLLHGEERYDYHGPIYAGDRLSIVTEVIGFEDKKGGALELAHLRSEIRHPERGLLASITRSLVHRLG